MTVFDTLLAPVMPILRQLEAERFKHHNETFLWIDFVRVLVFYFTKRCGSRNALIVALENAEPALAVPHVPAMTLSDAFRLFPPSLLPSSTYIGDHIAQFARKSRISLIGRVCA